MYHILNFSDCLETLWTTAYFVWYPLPCNHSNNTGEQRLYKLYKISHPYKIIDKVTAFHVPEILFSETSYRGKGDRFLYGVYTFLLPMPINMTPVGERSSGNVS
jgi:hypothetical protein